jgi:hypothetical protein
LFIECISPGRSKEGSCMCSDEVDVDIASSACHHRACNRGGISSYPTLHSFPESIPSKLNITTILMRN